jgi:hypothetical protein
LEMCVDLHPFQIAVYIPSVSVLMVAAVWSLILALL